MDPRNRCAVLVFVMALGMTCSYLPGQASKHVTDHPGILRTFLANNKRVATQRKLLGTLGSPSTAKATFIAIIASDPAIPAVKVKGLEVRLKEGSRRETIYLDDDWDQQFQRDSLKDFQESLAFLAHKDEQYWRTHDPAALDGSVTVAAMNRSSGKASVPRETVLSAGWYRRGDEFGVAIAGARWYNFPNAALSSLVDIIAAAHAFLEPDDHGQRPRS